jgi:hypothetical protein
MDEYRIYKVDKSGKTTGPPYIVQCQDEQQDIACWRKSMT